MKEDKEYPHYMRIYTDKFYIHISTSLYHENTRKEFSHLAKQGDTLSSLFLQDKDEILCVVNYQDNKPSNLDRLIGKLKTSSSSIRCGTSLCIYMDIDTREIWYMPEDEFFDGKFVRVYV